jgi:hypothetical protein
MSYGRDLTGDIMRMFAVPDEPEWIDVEPVDELAIEAAMDYCETCGKFTDGEMCVACGDDEREATPHGYAHADDGTPCVEPVWCQRGHVRTPENRSGNPA